MDSDFSAKEPSLGYIYQIKYSLLLILQSARNLQNPRVRIENLDDIEIGDINILNLYQTKLHIKGTANLTDASVDFWKTIRIWSENITSNLIDANNTLFNLITTQKVSEGTVLKSLMSHENDSLKIKSIILKLEQITLDSTNMTNQKAYTSFSKLTQIQKEQLVKNIHIYDNSISISEIDEQLRKELIFSSYPTHLDAFLEILNGWWLKKSIKLLTNEIEFIDSAELQVKIANIRDSFDADNLPNHFPDQLEITDEEVQSYKEKHFLKQLDLILLNITSKTTKRAISDFRRAYEQRSKWIRLQLLNPDEEEDYDKRLIDYWKNIFDIMCDQADGGEDEKLQTLGNSFYVKQFAERCPSIKIREKFNEDYLTRGSYQMLADSKKIGWHPLFKEKL